MTNPPAASRPSPPEVAPIEHDGVRYKQDTYDEHQGDQAGGYLAAFDIKSGQRLWRIKVYEVPDYRAAGMPLRGRDFRSMRLAPDKATLEIEDQAGGRYLVDLATRKSLQIGGPPAAAPTKPSPPSPDLPKP